MPLNVVQSVEESCPVREPEAVGIFKVKELVVVDIEMPLPEVVVAVFRTERTLLNKLDHCVVEAVRGILNPACKAVPQVIVFPLLKRVVDNPEPADEEA